MNELCIYNIRIGSTMGSVKQQISWIHIDDFCSIVKWMIENKTATSAYNIIAPQPLTNKKLMSLSWKKVGINFALPTPKWILEIGAFFIRTKTKLVLKSRYVVPEKLLQENFKFKYPTIKTCIDFLKPQLSNL